MDGPFIWLRLLLLLLLPLLLPLLLLLLLLSSNFFLYTAGEVEEGEKYYRQENFEPRRP